MKRKKSRKIKRSKNYVDLQEILGKLARGEVKSYQQIEKKFENWALEQINEEFSQEKDLENIIGLAIPPTNPKAEIKYWGKKIFYIFDNVKLELSQDIDKERKWNLYLANARIKSTSSIFEKELIIHYSGRKIEDKIGISYTIENKDNKDPDMIRLWKSENIYEIFNLIQNTNELSELSELKEKYKTIIKNISDEEDRERFSSDLVKSIELSNFLKYSKKYSPNLEKISEGDKNEINKIIFKDLFFKTYEILKESRTKKNQEAIEQFIVHLMQQNGIDPIKKAPPIFEYVPKSNPSKIINLDACVQSFRKEDNIFDAYIINTSSDENASSLIQGIFEDIKNLDYTRYFELIDHWTHIDEYNDNFDEIKIRTKRNETKNSSIFYFYDKRKDENNKEYGHTILVKKGQYLTLINGKLKKEKDRKKVKIGNEKLETNDRRLFLEDSYKLLEKILLTDETDIKEREKRLGSWGKSFSRLIRDAEIPEGFEKNIELDNQEYDRRIKELTDRFGFENIPKKSFLKEYWNETKKKSGYEKYHVYVTLNGKQFEVQLGDQFTNWNNKYGSASHKEGMESDKVKGKNQEGKTPFKKFSEYAINKHPIRSKSEKDKKEKQKKEKIEEILSKMNGSFNELKLNFYLGEKIEGTQGERTGGKINDLLTEFKNNPEDVNSYILGIRMASKLYHHIKTYSGKEHADRLIKKDVLFSYIKNYFNTIDDLTDINNPKLLNGLRCIEAITSQDFWTDKELENKQNYIIKDIMIKNYNEKLIEYFNNEEELKEEKFNQVDYSIELFIRAMSIKSGDKVPLNIVEKEYRSLINKLPEYVIDNSVCPKNKNKVIEFYKKMSKTN